VGFVAWHFAGGGIRAFVTGVLSCGASVDATVLTVPS